MEFINFNFCLKIEKQKLYVCEISNDGFGNHFFVFSKFLFIIFFVNQ